MRCKFGNHDVEALDYVTHERGDKKTFVYCSSHEPLKPEEVRRLTEWATITPSTGP